MVKWCLAILGFVGILVGVFIASTGDLQLAVTSILGSGIILAVVKTTELLEEIRDELVNNTSKVN